MAKRISPAAANGWARVLNREWEIRKMDGGILRQRES
jgi:hypothetical protein